MIGDQGVVGDDKLVARDPELKRHQHHDRHALGSTLIDV